MCRISAAMPLEIAWQHANCAGNAHTATVVMQIKLAHQERNLLVAMLRDQADSAMQDSYARADSPRKTATNLQRGVSDNSVLAGSLRERFTGTLPRSESQQAQSSQPVSLNADAGSVSKRLSSDAAAILSADMANVRQAGAVAQELPADSLQGGHAPVLSAHAMSLPARTQQLHSQQISRGLSGVPFSAIKLRTLGLGRIAEHQADLSSTQQALWQKKVSLCPDIKNCIQEVQQLRAQLSLESSNLFNDSKT